MSLNQSKKSYLRYATLILLPLISSCSGGGGSSQTNNTTPLSEYKSLLTYVPSSSLRSGLNLTANNQQSFSVESTVVLTRIRVEFFNNNNCNSSGGGLIKTIDMNGGAGVAFPSGTYTSSGTSNYALCQRYDSSDGCTVLYDAFTANTQQSLRFIYSYGVGSGGPGDVTGSCMSGSESSDYKETILDWSANGGVSQWGECRGNNCGFSQSYNESLPSTYNNAPSILITDLTGNTVNMMGTSNITFTATISGSGTSTVSATLTNSVTGLIVSDPSPCSLNVLGVSSCTFSILPWYTGFDNSTVGVPGFDPYTPSDTSILLMATNNATISGGGVTANTINYLITTPYVYLAAPMEGAATESNTGITWGPGGTVSTRFEAGTADGGGACPSGQEVRVDNLTGLMWVQAPSSTTYRWANAQTSPAIPATYCGYTDWRLPTETELLSLVNYAAPNGDLAAWLITQGFTNIQVDNYWSATPTSNNTSVWILNLADGSNGTIPKNLADGAYVWPVRSR